MFLPKALCCGTLRSLLSSHNFGAQSLFLPDIEPRPSALCLSCRGDVHSGWAAFPKRAGGGRSSALRPSAGSFGAVGRRSHRVIFFNGQGLFTLWPPTAHSGPFTLGRGPSQWLSQPARTRLVPF